MKIKTSELSGVALDWAVAQVAGVEVEMRYDRELTKVHDRHGIRLIESIRSIYSPSTYWSQGGPLIERFKVDIITERDCLVSAYANDDKYQPLTEDMYGSDHLIAACRAIVAAKLGDEVDVPEGLV